MAESIGVACNIYNDANALPGFLENVSKFFDDIVFYHAGPQGAYSTDGTIEILEKWKVRVVFGKIDDGFGIVRTAAVRACQTSWVMILDTDERFHMHAPVLVPHGDHTSPEGVSVEHTGQTYTQGKVLRELIERSEIDAIKSIRRHWYDFSWKRPTQNWHRIPDVQLRIVRNVDKIQYQPDVRMHERLIDASTGRDPRHPEPDFYRGIFHDHYHCLFKPMEKDQREHDVRIYDAIHSGKLPPVT